MLSNYQPLCPTTGLVNLFSTFSGVTKSISKAEEPSPHYGPDAHDPTAQERREPEHVALTNDCCTRRGEAPRVAAKLIIWVQFSVSAEVTQLCHTGR